MVVKKRTVCYFVFIFFFLLQSNFLFAQQTDCPESQNKKAVKIFKEANDLFKSRKYSEALPLVVDAIDEDPEFADAYLLQGNIALKKHDDHTMEQSFKKVIELCPDLDAEVYFQLGSFYFDMKRFSDSEKPLKKFLEFEKISEEHISKAEGMLVKAKLISHPVPFDPKPVAGISTPDPEYLPYISPDNEIAFFTRRFEAQDRNMLTAASVEKFMTATRANGSFDKGSPMPFPFNQKNSNNEGGATITVDNSHLYFTVNQNGNFDICGSDFSDGRWNEIYNLGPTVNDARQWDAQPSVTPDGNTLYFSSSRDSLTGIDIYVTHKNEEGKWSKAKKLSPVINTNGNDKCPFIHSDTKTLYFSSDSLPGLGGYDIYMSQLGDDRKWSKPVNLGYPINTEADEVGFFVSTDGKTGYFASNKLQGSRGFDIFSFNLYPAVRPQEVYLQKGKLNVDNEEGPVSASIEIRNTLTKEMSKIDVDSVTGKYAFVVNFKNDLLMTVKKNGYAFQSQYLSTNDTANNHAVTKDIIMKEIKVGGQYPLHDILFSTNSNELNDTIKTVLDNFAEYLLENSNLHIDINGYTDNVGDHQSNIALSENRARTVFMYLVSKQIDNSRLSYKGFGEAKPVASNDTEEGKARNRRTVFVVTSK